jgi:hypothetical protein
MQMRGDVAGATAEVGDPAGDGLGERRQQRPVQRLAGQLVAEQLRVRLRDGVVRAAGRVERIHTPHRSRLPRRSRLTPIIDTMSI